MNQQARLKSELQTPWSAPIGQQLDVARKKWFLTIHGFAWTAIRCVGLCSRRSHTNTVTQSGPHLRSSTPVLVQRGSVGDGFVGWQPDL